VNCELRSKTALGVRGAGFVLAAAALVIAFKIWFLGLCTAGLLPGRFGVFVAFFHVPVGQGGRRRLFFLAGGGFALGTLGRCPDRRGGGGR